MVGKAPMTVESFAVFVNTVERRLSDANKLKLQLNERGHRLIGECGGGSVIR